MAREGARDKATRYLGESRVILKSPEPGVVRRESPMHAQSASPAAIFRIIASERPTLLLDEVDAIFGRRESGDENEDLRCLLNSDHRGGATIPKCVDRMHDARRFPVRTSALRTGR